MGHEFVRPWIAAKIAKEFTAGSPAYLAGTSCLQVVQSAVPIGKTIDHVFDQNRNFVSSGINLLSATADVQLLVEHLVELCCCVSNAEACAVRSHRRWSWA